MKRKSFLILSILVFSLLVGSAFAATEITGQANGRAFGVMTMDIASPATAVTIEDFNTSDNCDNVRQICYLEGFSWSDAIGWTVWDGALLETDIVGNSGVFPDEFFAKTTFRGSLDGFIWNENTGWIQLSTCAGENTAPLCNANAYCSWTGISCEIDATQDLPRVDAQTSDDFGVYIDFCQLNGDATSCNALSQCNWNVDVCVLDNVTYPNGHPLNGFAWSEYLGWIKFGLEVGDTGFTGAFTQWLPDLTPPDVNALLDNAWIPNTSNIGTINWLEFANEPESSVDPLTSIIEYTLDSDSGYNGCSASGTGTVSQTGQDINVSFPLIGLVDSTVSNRHCRYLLSGVVYNTSGFGYFFGQDAVARAAAAGVNTADPLPHIINVTPNPYLNTLAGSYDPVASNLTFSGNAVADALTPVDSVFSPRDIAGNPLVTVPYDLTATSASLANSVRNVYLNYNFDATEYVFDRVNYFNNTFFGNPAPLAIGAGRTSYNFGTGYITNPIQYPVNGAGSIDAKNLADSSYLAGNYELPLYGLAPTVSVNNVLTMDSIDFNTNTLGLNQLPAVSPSMPVYSLVSTTTIDNGGSPLYSYNFDPALDVTAASLDVEFIALGGEINATYNFRNLSTNITLDDYAFDQIIEFTNISGSIGEEVIETKNINIGNSPTSTGRTDPVSGETRYHVFHTEGVITTAQSNEFYNANRQYHAPLYDFSYDNLTTTSLNLAGEYNVDGAYYANPTDITIGRGTSLTTTLPPSTSSQFVMNMQPNQYIGVPINAQIAFGINQYLAYNSNDPVLTQYAIYPASNVIDNIDVSSAGLGTNGVVRGENIFEAIGGRDLENITTTTSADLRKEMRRNVAQLTRNMDLANCRAGVTTLTTLSTTANNCILVDNTNQSVIAVYSGNGANETLNLGNGAILNIPNDYRYTLILTDGANLNIESNLVYGNANSSFGMILLQDQTGNGANVYIDPAPTNIVGLLYAEGSILSSRDAGTTLYYGAGADSGELVNQLFWQGSIASRNTIGGSPNNVVPDGADCSPWPDQQSCAQAHDLDFIRRFITINDSGNEYSPNGYQFSGGGSCAGVYPTITCALGGVGLPTTIALTANFIDAVVSSSLDTFFIEGDNRAVPLGFTSAANLTSSQEIR